MPNKKPYRSRKTRKTYKKKGFLEKALPVAQKALKVAKFVAGIINAEFKYNLASASLVTPTWNGTVTSLCLPSQGSGADQRTGDSIKLKDFVIRGVIDFNALGVPEMVRVVIFIDKQNAITTGAQFFQTVGVYLATESEKNEDNKYETKTLFDRTFMVSNYKPQTKFKYAMPIGYHTHFTKGTTAISNNALKMCYISQNPTNSAKISYIVRTGYVDN